MTAPRVGIVVPAYNAERFLAATLDAVLAQRFAAWAGVVVDDGSRDRTVEIARSFAARDARMQVAVQSANAGVSAARQAGAAALPATEFLIFLDADDVWHPDALATLVATLDDPRHAAAPAAHTSARFVGVDEEPLDPAAFAARLRRLELLDDGAIVEPAGDAPTSARMLATWPCVLTPGVVLIRRSAWDASGGFDAALSIGEDWELWYRLALRAGPLAYVDEPLIDFRVHASSSSNTWKRSLKLAAARRRVFAAGDVDQRRYARRAYRATSRRLGVERLRAGVASLKRLRLPAAAKSIAAGTVNLALSVRP